MISADAEMLALWFSWALIGFLFGTVFGVGMAARRIDALRRYIASLPDKATLEKVIKEGLGKD